MLRVLVVDDAADNRELYAQFLSYKGFAVDTAASGADALAKVATTPPDAIILDLSLPDMDGWEVARALKAKDDTMTIPVIVVSGHANGETIAKEVGCAEYLMKPCLPGVLFDAIERSISRPSP